MGVITLYHENPMASLRYGPGKADWGNRRQVRIQGVLGEGARQDVGRAVRP